MAVEETKTNDKESRNTGVSQRATKFIYAKKYCPEAKLYMLYNDELENNENKKPSDTNIFGTNILTNILLTLGVKIVGKSNFEWFAPFTSIEEEVENTSSFFVTTILTYWHFCVIIVARCNMEKSFIINLSSDTDGFLEYECPFCEQKFRLATNEFQGNGDYSELFCPYCKLKSSSENFYTKEGIHYIEECKEIIAENLTIETIKNANKNNKFFKLTTKHKKRALPNPPILEESNMTNKKCVECEHEFKILNGHISTCCPYCSKE